MDEEESRERLKHAVSLLPRSCRVVAQMHHFSGLTPEQIDRIWKSPPGEARQKLDEADRLLPALMLIKPPARPVPVPARGFHYLLDPELMVRGRPDPQSCVVCAGERPGFDLVVEHADGWDRHYVCEPCLRSGRLAERGMRMNEAARSDLASQLEALCPDLSPAQREEMAGERTRTVECGTPRPSIMQPFEWPAHCGDYFGFVGSVSKADLLQLAPEGQGLEFFSSHVQREEWTDEEWVTQVWAEGFAPEGFVATYLWRCLHCADYLITWCHD